MPFTATGKERAQFFAGRLKFSRFMHVVLVPDQQAETLVRSLFACLVEFGGSPKEWVFDNPRTVGSRRSVQSLSCCTATCARRWPSAV